MEKSMLYFETGSVDPYVNLAFEEYVLKHYTDKDCWILWQNDKSVIIGKNQNAAAEINAAYVKAHNIQVVRRETGGGAVFHDLGNINYSYITDVENPENLTLHTLAEPIISALKHFGIDADVSGRNDILVQGRKVSGTAQKIYRKRILYHGTLLYNADLTMMENALQVDPLKIETRAEKSVKSRVCNLCDMIPGKPGVNEFCAEIKKHLIGNATKKELSEAEWKEIHTLAEDKYRNWYWTFGNTPPYTQKTRKRWTGGSLEAWTIVNRGVIDRIKFYGDYFSHVSTFKLEQALCGCAMNESEIRGIVIQYFEKEMFVNMSPEEVVQTILGE